MESSKDNLSARGKGVLSLALEKLVANPPEVLQLSTEDLCDSVVYHKKIGDTVVAEMLKRGYKVAPPPRWTANFESHTEFLERLKLKDLEQSEFERSLQRAKERLDKMKIQSPETSQRSEEEWEDIDTSLASNKSLSSKGASRNTSIQNAKKSLKQMMLDSAKKNANTSVKVDPNKSSRIKKITSSNDSQTSKGERTARALKRQASTVVASDPKKDKKNSTLELEKTEFARSQNSRVQLVKERKEIQDKERNEQIKAKLQQKQTTMKEKERKRPKAAQKATAAGAKSVRTTTTSSGAPSNSMKPPPVPENSHGRNASRVNSMKTKAKQDRGNGALIKQAMLHAKVAAGDGTVPADGVTLGDAMIAPAGHTQVNSTFLPGLEVKPDFDASLALKGTKETYVILPAANTTYISKPGLAPSPQEMKNVKKTAISFIDSFNETFRDYGLDDLCSDSDNTDDENAPSKPVPKWADLKSARFKGRIERQRQLGNDITKYGLFNIYMPPSVDLEVVFEESSKRFHHDDVSSGIWNETQDFIRN